MVRVDYIIEEVLKPALKISDLVEEAKKFCKLISNQHHADIKGVTDGKAVGTYLEHGFKNQLKNNYEFDEGSSALGVDFPSDSINTDIKVTSIIQPQSSSPFRNASQKVFGLGYNLLLFVYDKDDSKKLNLDIVDCAFISENRTADYTTTKGILDMIDHDANEEDIGAYLNDKNLPLDEIQLNELSKKIISTPPTLGYLTISNALQWRLQYKRIVELKKNQVEGINKIL